MWVFVYSGLNEQGGYTGTEGVRVDHGQYFFQDESDPNLFWTYDRAYGQGFVPIRSALKVTIDFYLIYVNTDYNEKLFQFLYRLDIFNCKNWNMCNLDGKGGSYYSLRSDINVYNKEGLFMETIIAATYDIVFAIGYGFTKVTTVNQLSCGGTGIAVYGKRRKSDGMILRYYNDPGRYFYASDLICAHPSTYKINTF